MHTRALHYDIVSPSLEVKRQPTTTSIVRSFQCYDFPYPHNADLVR
uniref:Uncharacterized protein n=1 Tax=Rhizophora mucronata TaxID=61149 RepID=A0A2P2M2D0_RHIMU